MRTDKEYFDKITRCEGVWNNCPYMAKYGLLRTSRIRTVILKRTLFLTTNNFISTMQKKKNVHVAALHRNVKIFKMFFL